MDKATCPYCHSDNSDFIDYIDDLEEEPEYEICLGVFLCRECDQYFEHSYTRLKKTKPFRMPAVEVLTEEMKELSGHYRKYTQDWSGGTSGLRVEDKRKEKK